MLVKNKEIFPKNFLKNQKLKVIEILKNGGIGVLSTDTLYGLVGSALMPEIVERIYKVRERNPQKPMIILISSYKDLGLFDIKIDTKIKKIISKFWPGPMSIIFPCPNKKFQYLHRGTKTLAFRLPKNKELIDILKETGPLAAPSTNPEGLSPALTIKEAKRYFKDEVDFYLDVGKRDFPSSTLIRIEKDKIVRLR